MAFCVDDRDAPGHPDALPAGLYEPFSHDGVTDFGYPEDWRPVTFEGAVPLAVRLRERTTPAAVGALLGTILIAFVASGIRLRLRTARALRRVRAEAARDASRAMENERVLKREVELALQAAEAAVLLEERGAPSAPPAPVAAPAPAPAPVPPTSSEPTAPTAPTAADRIVRHLEEHHAEELTMEGVARALAFSVKTMERILKKRGTTYVALLTEIRMTRARDLLLHSERSITEIAFDVGYSDSSYFTKVFRRHHGITPTLMRREYAAAMQAPGVRTAELPSGAEA
jgi:AraC-like DNA-binding protein